MSKSSAEFFDQSSTGFIQTGSLYKKDCSRCIIISSLQGDDGQPGQAGGDGVGGLAVSKYGQHSVFAHISTSLLSLVFNI